MPNGVYLGFDFGFKHIGVAVGQAITCSASPLPTLQAIQGVPDWGLVDKLMKAWQPEALIVGLPTTAQDEKLYTTKPAKKFAKALETRFNIPVHLVDERLSTKEARSRLFSEGGFRKLQQSEVDSIAACVILEQWLAFGGV